MGYVELAHKRLDRWRRKYFAARGNAVNAAMKRYLSAGSSDQERAQLAALLAETEPEAVTEELARHAHKERLPLKACASFRQLVAIRARRGQIAGSGPEWRLNSKERGYAFAARLRVPHPQVYVRGVTVDELEPRQQVVVKPEAGAGGRGVYLVLGDGRVVDLRDGAELPGWPDMLASMRQDLTSGRVKQDRWLVEELITEDEGGLYPGRDLKFYCFYGKVGLVLEVRRSNANAYCEWDAEGNQLFSGKYDERRFEGEGATAEQVALAGRMSRKIPAPFMRIDFIRSATAPSGMSFCEFTPRPGSFHRFEDAFDRRMGEYYLDAEARLERDLLRGKSFKSPFSGKAKRVRQAR